MNPVSGIVVFVMIWWMVLFCVLPIGQETQFQEHEGAPGSPRKVDMKKKLLVTTCVSVFFWIIAYVIIQSDIIDPRRLSLGG